MWFTLHTVHLSHCRQQRSEASWCMWQLSLLPASFQVTRYSLWGLVDLTTMTTTPTLPSSTALPTPTLSFVSQTQPPSHWTYVCFSCIIGAHSPLQCCCCFVVVCLSVSQDPPALRETNYALAGFSSFGSEYMTYEGEGAHLLTGWPAMS